MFWPVPEGVIVGLVSGALVCVVTEIYCHRCLAHRALSVHPVLASLMSGFMQVYGGAHPQRWAGVHRLHHRYADTPLDPHSPLERNPLLVLVGTPYLFAQARHRLAADASPPPAPAAVVVRIAVTAFWLWAIGPVQTLLAVAVHLGLYFGIMGMVNTAGHRAGRKPHPGVPGYDLAWTAPLLLGHGYHNSHHAHPSAARMGLLDPMWPLVRALSGLRLVTLDGSPLAPSRTCCRAGVTMASSR
jgi:fatty-acid desaturase